MNKIFILPFLILSNYSFGQNHKEFFKPEEQCVAFLPPPKLKPSDKSPLDLLYLKCVDQSYDDRIFSYLNSNLSSNIGNSYSINSISKINEMYFLASTRITFLNLLNYLNGFIISKGEMTEHEKQEVFKLSNNLKNLYNIKSISINEETKEFQSSDNGEVIYIISENETELDSKIINQFRITNKLLKKNLSLSN